MGSEELKKYIREAQKSGKSQEEIRKSLLRSGWQESDVQSAFAALEMPETPTLGQEPGEINSVSKQANKESFTQTLLSHFKRPWTY